MAKLKITQKQYDAIILNEQKSRLNILTENTKEVVLSVASLAGVKLSGQNDFIAKEALKDEKTIDLIKSTLESEDKVKELADSMTEKGMKDPNSFLSKNADSIVKKFNDISGGKKLDFISVTNLKNLGGK
jgi:hypothetical protein